MAWSPVWRFNARINWVGQPGDYANLIPTTPATAPDRSIKRQSGFVRSLTRVCATAARYFKDTEGATAVEFALVSVPFLGLLFAIFETAFVFFTAQTVEAATAEAARQVMTGQAKATTGQTATTFRDSYICSPASPMVRILPSYIDCSTIVVDIRTATSWSSANQSKSFMTDATHTYCTGNGGDVIVLRVGYYMPVYLSVLSMNGLGLGHTSTVTSGLTNNKHLIVATSVFQNEPFPASTHAC